MSSPKISIKINYSSGIQMEYTTQHGKYIPASSEYFNGTIARLSEDSRIVIHNYAMNTDEYRKLCKDMDTMIAEHGNVAAYRINMEITIWTGRISDVVKDWSQLDKLIKTRSEYVEKVVRYIWDTPRITCYRDGKVIDTDSVYPNPSHSRFKSDTIDFEQIEF